MTQNKRTKINGIVLLGKQVNAFCFKVVLLTTQLLQVSTLILLAPKVKSNFALNFSSVWCQNPHFKTKLINNSLLFQLLSIHEVMQKRTSTLSFAVSMSSLLDRERQFPLLSYYFEVLKLFSNLNTLKNICAACVFFLCCRSIFQWFHNLYLLLFNCFCCETVTSLS